MAFSDAAVQLNALAVCLDLDIPAILWGKPGIGKSKTVEAIAKARGVHCETVIASLREPTDFSGLPLLVRFPAMLGEEKVKKVASTFCSWINGGKSEGELKVSEEEVLESLPDLIRIFGQPEVRGARVDFAPPSWAVRLVKLGKGILFLDEISTARPAVQAALLRVVLDRYVGDLQLPKEVRIIAAANPPNETPGCWDLSPPLANRFCHLEWRLSAKDWCDGFLYDWPTPSYVEVPKDWKEDCYDQSRTLVASFIKGRPELLLQVPEDETKAGRAWPSGRTWEMSAKLHAAATACGGQFDAPEKGRELEILLVQGCIGDSAALEFFHYSDELDLVDPEELLADPMGPALPGREDQLYAVLAAVVIAYRGEQTQARWQSTWRVLDRAAKEVGSLDVPAVHALALYKVHRSAEQRFPAPKEVHTFRKILQRAGAFGTPPSGGAESAQQLRTG